MTAASEESPDSEWRALLAIALPVVVVQVGLMLMGVVDTLVVGHMSARALAAVALGNLYVYNVIVLAMGALMALDPLVAQAVGAGDKGAVTRWIQRGLLLALGFGIATMLAMIPAAPVLRWFHQPAEVVPVAAMYAHVSAAGFVPFLLFVVLRQSLQAVGRLAPIVVTIVLANLLNAALNWVLVFGKLGVAPMGVAGSALATVVSRWAMVMMLLMLAWPVLRAHLRPLDPASYTPGPLWRMLRLGLPIGLQLFLEVSAFGAVGLLMGTFGTEQVASHQIALNLASLTFMVPLGISAAAAVRVGHAVGAGAVSRARLAAHAAGLLGAGFMTTTALLFRSAPHMLARLYTSDARLIAIAASFLPIAGLFQIFDGLQAVGGGVLRGLGDTRVPVLAMISGFWLIGVPVSVVLGFGTSLGPKGLWWGYVAGLAAVACFLWIRIVLVFRRGVARLQLEGA